MNVCVQNHKDISCAGITIRNQQETVHQATEYYTWQPGEITVPFVDPNISVGLVCSYPHEILFTKCEYHSDYELYVFFSGKAVMLLCDIKNGKVVQGSEQLLYVEAGMQLLLHPSKGHFVPIAIHGDPIRFFVVSPKNSTCYATLSTSISTIL